MAIESTGLPLLPKFKGTGLSVKEALEASLVAAGVEPVTAHSLAMDAKPAKVAKAKKAKVVVTPDPVADAYATTAAIVPSAGVKYSVTLPDALFVRVIKPINGQGGWQTTATLMQQAMGNGGVLYLDSMLWSRIVHQSVTGSGGWQSVCRHVVCLVVSKYGIGAGA